MYSERRHRMDRSGGILLLALAGSGIFLGLLALVVDIGWLYYGHNQLQTAVDSAWKAGQDHMIQLMAASLQPLNETEQAAVVVRIKDLLRENGLEEDEVGSVQIRFASPGEYPGSLSILAEKHLNLFFARTMNLFAARVTAVRSNFPAASDTAVTSGPVPNGNGPSPAGPRSLERQGFVVPLGIVFAAGAIPSGSVSLPAPEGFSPGHRQGLFPGSATVSVGGPVAIDFSRQGDTALFEKYLSFGYLKTVAPGNPVPLFTADVTAELRRGIAARRLAGAWGKTVIVPLLALSASPGDSGVAPETARIIGFGEFALEDATGEITPETLRASFRRYVIRPGEETGHE